MEHMGIEPGRLQFSWVSSAEATKFVDVVKSVTDTIKARKSSAPWQCTVLMLA